jgi:hypothetical protein
VGGDADGKRQPLEEMNHFQRRAVAPAVVLRNLPTVGLVVAQPVRTVSSAIGTGIMDGMLRCISRKINVTKQKGKVIAALDG